MPHNDAFRSHAFCKPRFLDGQGDDILGKRPAWEGTVASRIRSLNDRDNAARTDQASLHPRQESREESKSSSRPKSVLNRLPLQAQVGESHHSDGPSGHTNPFVRRNLSKSGNSQQNSDPPTRVSHSEVPVRSPLPSVLVQRPTFIRDRTQPVPPPATRDFAGPVQSTDSRQCSGRQMAGNNFPGAGPTSPAPKAGSGAVRSLSPDFAHATARRFEELESKESPTASGLETGARAAAAKAAWTAAQWPERRDGSATASQKQRMQLEAPGTLAIATRKSQPELRTKKDSAPNLPEAAPDARHGLTNSKGSSPNFVRPTSPSVGLGPRTTPFGQAGRVRSVSPDEYAGAKADRVPRNHARMEGIDSIVQDIETTSVGIEATAREIKAAAHRIGLLSPPLTISNIEVRSTGSRVTGVEPHSHVKLQGQPLLAQTSSVVARMRRETPDHTSPNDGDAASSPPGLADSIDDVLAEHDSVLDNVIKQLQACGQRLQKIRSLSQQFGPLSRGSSTVPEQRDPASNCALVPITAENSVVPRASPSSINDPPRLQRRRTRSTPNIIYVAEDAGENLGLNDLKQAENEKLKEMTQELHRSNEVHELDAVATEADPISPGELQRLLSRPIFVSPRNVSPEPLESPLRTRPLLSTRYFNQHHENSIFPRTNGPAAARASTPTPPPSPPVFREELPTRLPRTRLHTTLPIPVTPPSPQTDEYGSSLRGRQSTPSSPHIRFSTRSSVTRHRHSRQPSSYLSAKRGIDYPITPRESAVSWPDTLQPTPEIYFPYQHLQAARDRQIDLSQPPAIGQGDYRPIFPTRREELKGPIVKTPDTPPPPPPLFSMRPDVEFSTDSGGLPSKAASPRPPLAPWRNSAENYLAPTDLARAATRAALEREHSELLNLSMVSLSAFTHDQSIVSKDMGSEGRTSASAARSTTYSEGRSTYSLMPSKEPSLSSSASNSRNSSSKQLAPLSPPQDLERSPRRPKPPTRRTAQRRPSPTSFLSISSTSSSSSSREPSPPPQFSKPLPFPAQGRRDSAHTTRNHSQDLTQQAQLFPPQFAPGRSISPGNAPILPYPESPLLIQPSASHSPETMATLADALLPQFNNPASFPSPLPSPIGPPPLSGRSSNTETSANPTPHSHNREGKGAAAAAALSTPPSSINLTIPAIAVQQPSMSDAGSNVAARSQLETASTIFLSSSSHNANSDAHDDNDEKQQQRHYYPPLNVLDRIHLLEEARKERMRVLRATGAVHGDVVRRFSVDDNESISGDGGGADVSSLGMKLGGPREQIAALGRPWW